MEKHIAYEIQGRFGIEYLVDLEKIGIVESRSTEKAYAVGEWDGKSWYIFGFVPKSQVVQIEGKLWVPTWIIDRFNYTHLQFTEWINSDYMHREWEIRKIA